MVEICGRGDEHLYERESSSSAIRKLIEMQIFVDSKRMFAGH